MRDIADTIEEWSLRRRSFALARVLRTWGSAPRSVGSAMAVTHDQLVVGSVSGGCVEGEVIDAAAGVIASGESRILDFGITNETAWSVGLSCGGKMSVLIERFPTFSEDPTTADAGREIIKALATSRPLTWLTGLPPGPPHHLVVTDDGELTGDPTLFGDSSLAAARAAYESRRSRVIEEDDRAYFVHVIPPRSVLLILGASDIATHLVRMAKGLDFETVVVDPRSIFAAEERFIPMPDRLVRQWPQEAFEDLALGDETYAVLLTHDPKLDDPALHVLLNSAVAYIGALGSSRTHARRLSRLSEAGFKDEQLGRICGPVGLDIGASSPAEIALSVMAQVVQARNRHSKT